MTSLRTDIITAFILAAITFAVSYYFNMPLKWSIPVSALVFFLMLVIKGDSFKGWNDERIRKQKEKDEEIIRRAYDEEKGKLLADAEFEKKEDEKEEKREITLN